MNHEKPFYHRSSLSFLGDYVTRLLGGMIGSLGLVVLLFNLPLLYSPPQIGWTSQRPAEPIALQELSSEEDTPTEKGQETVTTPGEAPPPTRHTPPAPNGSEGSHATSPNEPDSRENDTRAQSSSTPKMLAALTTEDRYPEIKGGSGALYLQIHYPEAARRQGIEGRLQLEFTVDREGQVHAIEVAKSLHPLCDSAAVKALRSVEFRPAVHEGNPIPVRMSLPIRFQLRVNDGGPLHTQHRPSSR